MWVSRLATFDRFEIEVEAGVAYVIGYVDKTELKKESNIQSLLQDI